MLQMSFSATMSCPLGARSGSTRKSGRKTSVCIGIGGTALAVALVTTVAVSCDGEDAKMYYRLLGSTGLKVSVLSYGFWATFGSKSDLQKDAKGLCLLYIDWFTVTSCFLFVLSRIGSGEGLLEYRSQGWY